MAPQAEEALLYEVYLHAEHEDAAGDAAAAEKGPVSHRNAQRPTSHRSDQQKHARTVVRLPVTIKRDNKNPATTIPFCLAVVQGKLLIVVASSRN